MRPIKPVLSMIGYLALLLLAALGSPTYANDDPALNSAPSGDISFDALPALEQRVLGRVKERWSELSIERRQRLRRGAQKWSELGDQERQFAQQRLKRWRELDPEKRRRMLRRLERYQGMTPEQRKNLRSTFRRFHKLPQQERARLREKWRNASPDERREIRQRLKQKMGGNARPGRP